MTLKTFFLALALGFSLTTAQAAALDQQVTGTVAGSLAINASTPAAFANLQPGQPASSVGGTVTVLSTSPSWTLSAKGANAGHLTQTGGTCTDSVATLANPLGLALSNPVGAGVNVATITLSGSDQTVASATAQPVPVTSFPTTFSQSVLGSETLAAGCIYGTTVTYTLSG